MPRPTSEEKRCEWQEKVRLQQESGQNIAHWCRVNQVHYDSFLYWRKRFSAPPAQIDRSSFKELSDPSAIAGITIEYKEAKITLTKQFDSSTLTQCLQVLKR